MPFPSRRRRDVSRISLVYTVHLPVGAADGLRSKPRGHLYGGAERLLLRLAPPTRIVHVSARALAQAAPGSNGRVVLIPNGVDLGRAAAPGARERVRAELHVPAGACVVTSVARLVPQKGLDLLLEAWAQAGMNGGSSHLWLAGDGPARAALEARAARLGLGERVALLGRRDDVPDVLAATDVFVLASREETTPIALLEAMAAGLACVATDVGDCRRRWETAPRSRRGAVRRGGLAAVSGSSSPTAHSGSGWAARRAARAPLQRHLDG